MNTSNMCGKNTGAKMLAQKEPALALGSKGTKILKDSSRVFRGRGKEQRKKGMLFFLKTKKRKRDVVKGIVSSTGRTHQHASARFSKQRYKRQVHACDLTLPRRSKLILNSSLS